LRHLLSLAVDYCDRSRRKTKLQDNTQRQQREKKNTTEILPFYLKKKTRRDEKKAEQKLLNRNPYSTPLPTFARQKSTYIFVCTLQKSSKSAYV